MCTITRSGKETSPESPGSVAEMLSVLHAEMLQRFDQQDVVLQQITVQVQAKKSLIPVAHMRSSSEGSSANASVGFSDASGGSHEAPRRKRLGGKMWGSKTHPGYVTVHPPKCIQLRCLTHSNFL